MTGLPKLTLPLFPITIPSTGLKTEFRPMTLKEEKILLIAQESNDVTQTILAIKQIISTCAPNLKVDLLASFDIEYLLIKIRAKSMSNIFEFSFKDDETDEKIDAKLNIDDLQVYIPEGHSKTFSLSGDTVLSMRYPSIDDYRSLVQSMSESTEKSITQQKMLDIMLNCIESIIVGDALYNLSKFTKEEISEFIDSMTVESVETIKTFFDTMPVLKYELKYVNKEGKEKTFVIQGLESFFI